VNAQLMLNICRSLAYCSSQNFASEIRISIAGVKRVLLLSKLSVIFCYCTAWALCLIYCLYRNVSVVYC